MAQIEYSEKLLPRQLLLTKNMVTHLKKTDFTYINTVQDDATSAKLLDSIKYSEILETFFDTAQISFLTEKQTYYMSKDEEANWLKMITVSNIFSIHNLLHCLPDSHLFIMPAAEYLAIEPGDERIMSTNQNFAVAGYKSDKYYFPGLLLMFSTDNSKFIYINLLINFDGYSRQKQEDFEMNLATIVEPCETRLSDVTNKVSGY